MSPASAAGAMVVAVLLATFGPVAAPAAAGSPAPALVLKRAAPLDDLEHLQKLDRARLVKRSDVPEFDLRIQPGIYYASVKLGTPPKEYSLQFATGSDLMWVSCSSCPGCPATDNLSIPLDFYDPNNSSTSFNISCADDRCKDAIKAGHSVCQASDYPNTQCGYHVAYADGDTSGYYVADTMYFDTVVGKGNEQAASSASVLFGCSYSRSNNLEADGILGFGKSAPSVILQLNSQGVSPKSFSHCLRSSDDGGGIVVLGEIMEPGLAFTPLVQSQPRYNLNMKSIAVNGQNVHIYSTLFTTTNTQGTLVDSGTALSYLADGVYDPVISAIDNAVPNSISSFPSDGDLCYIITHISNVSVFPVLTFNFEGGAQMTVGPANYLIRKGSAPSPNKKNIMCIGFQRSKELEDYRHITILGDNVLRDKIVVYDLEDMRLGWVNKNCSLLNKATVPDTLSVGSGPFRHHTPGIIVLAVVVIGINIILPG